MVIVCPMDAERDLVPALGARVIGLGGSCVRGLDKLVPHSALPILVIGLAGSLSQHCKPGSVYSVSSVVDSSGRTYKPGIHRLLAPLAVPEVRIACSDTLVCSPQAKADWRVQPVLPLWTWNLPISRVGVLLMGDLGA